MYEEYAKLDDNGLIVLRSTVRHEGDEITGLWSPDEARGLATRLIDLAEDSDRKAFKVNVLVGALEEIDVEVSKDTPGGPTWEDVARGLIDKGFV